MAQFDIHENSVRESQAVTPYLLDMQSNSTSDLPTRVVVPLRERKSFPSATVTRLHVSIHVHGAEYVAFVSELAAIPVSLLGRKVDNAERYRTTLVAATDLLFTGF